MPKTFEAVYENGVLRPSEALSLPDRTRVTVTIDLISAMASDPSGYFSPQEWEAAIHDEITLDEVRQALSSIDGCLSDAVTELR